MVEFSKEDIQITLNTAVQDVMSKDANLLKIKSSERGIVHWLAIYFEEHIKNDSNTTKFNHDNGYVVDVEYSRTYDDIKRFEHMKESLCKEVCPHAKHCKKYLGEATYYAVTLDMIFHKRVTNTLNDNVLCVEVKTTSANRNSANALSKMLSCDKKRIKYLIADKDKNEPTYQFGATVYIKSENDAQINFFEHGNQQYTSYTLQQNSKMKNVSLHSLLDV